jgi:hypothetical protein
MSIQGKAASFSSMNKQEQLNELARITNSIEPTPHIIGLTKIYTHYLPYLRLLELPVPSPEYMFQIFTVKEIETLLTTLHDVFVYLQIEDLIIFAPYEVLVIKDALELAAFAGRTPFETFIRDFVSTDMNYQKGGSKKYRNLFDTVIAPVGKNIMRGGVGTPVAADAPPAAAPSSSVLSLRNTTTLSLAVQEGATALAVRTQLGPALSSAFNNSITVREATRLEITTLQVNRRGRIAKYLADTEAFTKGLQKLKEQLNGNDLDILKNKFEETGARVVKEAQRRFVSQSSGSNRREMKFYNFEDAKVDLDKFKEESAKEFGVGFNKNGAILLGCALSIAGGIKIGTDQYQYLFNTHTSGTYPDNVKFQFTVNKNQKVQLKANVTAMWDPDTVEVRPDMSPEKLAKKAAAYKQSGRELPKITEPARPEPKIVKVEKCGWAAGNRLPAVSCGTNTALPSKQEIDDYEFRLQQWQQSTGVVKDSAAFVNFGNVLSLGKNGSAPELLNDQADFEFGECAAGYRFDAKQFKCLLAPPPADYLIWNDQAQRWDPRLVLTDGTNCLAPSTYFSAGSIATVGAAVGTATQFTRNPATLLAIGVGTYAVTAGTTTSAGACMAPLGATILGGSGSAIAGLAALGGLTVLAPLLALGGLYLGGRFIQARSKRQSILNKGDTDIKMIIGKIQKSWDTMITVQLRDSLMNRIDSILTFTAENPSISSFVLASSSILKAEIVVEIDNLLKEGKPIPDELHKRLIDQGVIQTIIDSWIEDSKTYLKTYAMEKKINIQNDPAIMLSYNILDKLRNDREIFVALEILRKLVPDALDTGKNNTKFNMFPKNFTNFNLKKLNLAAAAEALRNNELVLAGNTNTSTANVQAELAAAKAQLAKAASNAQAAQAQVANALRQRNNAIARAARAQAAVPAPVPVPAQAAPAPAQAAPAPANSQAAPLVSTSGGQIRNRETRRNRSGGKRKANRKVNRKTRRSRKH